MTMKESNKEYWLSKDGAEYHEQQVERAIRGGKSYSQQEAWLCGFLDKFAEKLNKKIRVLDYGCGFGRFAKILAEKPNVEYFGFDMSEAMVRPLLENPPGNLQPIAEKIKIGKNIAECFPEDGFDLIFTVSVFIHNDAETVRKIIKEMASHLLQNGQLCCIENKLVPIDIKENDWHGGCWLHDYIGDLLKHWNVDLYTEVVESHDIYVATKAIDQRKIMHISGDLEPVEISLTYSQILGLGRLANAIEHQENGHHADLAETRGKLLDALELNGYLNSKQQKMLVDLSMLAQSIGMQVGQIIDDADCIINEIGNKYKELSRLLIMREQEIENLNKIQNSRKNLTKIYSELADTDKRARSKNAERGENLSRSTEQKRPLGEFEMNAIRDTRYAHLDARFNRTCHVFHRDWFGIRSAAGCLPGNKLAIPSSEIISPEAIEKILELFGNKQINRLVFHGISENMRRLIFVLHDQGFRSIYLVWHGTTAQLAYEAEASLAKIAHELVLSGKLRGYHAIRRGMGKSVGQLHYPLQLLNLYPNLPASSIRLPIRGEGAVAFIPSWNDIRKNLAGNIIAAASNNRIEKIFIYAKNMHLSDQFTTKVNIVEERDMEGTLTLMQASDLILNATVIDCHPMVDLEALAVGTPTIRGPLFLDVLEDHEYSQFVTVQNPLNTQDIDEAIDRVLGGNLTQLKMAMADFKLKLKNISIQRYAEFLEL